MFDLKFYQSKLRLCVNKDFQMHTESWLITFLSVNQKVFEFSKVVTQNARFVVPTK